MQIRSLATLLLSLVLAGCIGLSNSNPGSEARLKVSGSLLFDDAGSLPLNARIDVYLLDVSNADAPAEVISSRRMEHAGKSPVAFELDYDPLAIEARHSYTVRAVIRQGETILYTSDMDYPVITRGGSHYVSVKMIKL